MMSVASGEIANFVLFFYNCFISYSSGCSILMHLLFGSTLGAGVLLGYQFSFSDERLGNLGDHRCILCIVN
jgi:hypothetical protein